MYDFNYASKQLQRVQNRINNAAKAANRHASEVTLVGASKRQSADLIRHFATSGLQCLGENYLQEAIEKQASLSDISLNWHFIGQIQSNKTKLIAQHFTWVHGIDRLKIAQRIGAQNRGKEAINILIQVNIDAETSKGGVPPDNAAQLCDEISELDGIKLRGFMLIPASRDSQIEQRAVFASARELLEQTNQRYGLALDSLSMGMSGDLEAAVAEGSTMVRVGTDLFGLRQ